MKAYLDTKFNLGDTVFLKTDIAQHERLVSIIQINMANCIMYCLSCGVDSTWHYEQEISADKKIFEQEILKKKK